MNDQPRQFVYAPTWAVFARYPFGVKQCDGLTAADRNGLANPKDVATHICCVDLEADDARVWNVLRCRDRRRHIQRLRRQGLCNGIIAVVRKEKPRQDEQSEVVGFHDSAPCVVGQEED
jgi:hypothetical protein